MNPPCRCLPNIGGIIVSHHLPHNRYHYRRYIMPVLRWLWLIRLSTPLPQRRTMSTIETRR